MALIETQTTEGLKMLTISNVKRIPGMENTGWACALLLDGKKVGTATERGMGAGVDLDIPKPADHKRIHEHCLALYKAAGEHLELLDTVPPFDGYASDFLVECAVAPLLRQHDIDKMMKGWCKTKIMFQVPGENPDQWRSITKKYVPETDRAEMVKRFGKDVVILNDRFL